MLFVPRLSLIFILPLIFTSFHFVTEGGGRFPKPIVTYGRFPKVAEGQGRLQHPFVLAAIYLGLPLTHYPIIPVPRHFPAPEENPGPTLEQN
jgi:hypothetical protein